MFTLLIVFLLMLLLTLYIPMRVIVYDTTSSSFTRLRVTRKLIGGNITYRLGSYSLICRSDGPDRVFYDGLLIGSSCIITRRDILGRYVSLDLKSPELKKIFEKLRFECNE